MKNAAEESILIFGALKIDPTNFLKNSLIIENKNQETIFIIQTSHGTNRLQDGIATGSTRALPKEA